MLLLEGADDAAQHSTAHHITSQHFCLKWVSTWRHQDKPGCLADMSFDIRQAACKHAAAVTQLCCSVSSIYQSDLITDVPKLTLSKSGLLYRLVCGVLNA